ncbi:MAG TPA: LamG domain-containing protein [Bryobacteraceae bacterium]|nr:LamG domain-containing protein [Bryobacteraceae bacterium]
MAASFQTVTMATDPYSTIILAKAPVGYWRLGESSGPTAADSSNNSNNGTYLGDPNFAQPGAIAASTNTAVGLRGYGSGDYIEIPDPDSASFSQSTSGAGLSVEVWMRPDLLVFPGQTAQPYIHWLGKGEQSQYEWGLRFYSQDVADRPSRISAYLWNPAGGEGAGAYFQNPKLEPGAWIHIVACYDPGDWTSDPPAGVSIYQNGELQLGPPSSGTLYRTFNISPAHGSAPVRLGARDDLTFTLAGGLDEVAIYARVLTADEVLEDYRTGMGLC